MTENQIKTDALRTDIRESVRIFAERLFDALGSNLQSITVVGSSLTADFHVGRSDINTVCVLGERTLQSLKALAALTKQMRKRRISAPLLMTKEYIERSRDVFGIELLDLQLTHATIYGDDPFEGLEFTNSDVRLQCERELKATLIRLRQGFVASAANTKLVRDILVSAAVSLVPLLRAMLWLKDIDRPKSAKDVLSKAAQHFGIDTTPVADARNLRYEKTKLDRIQTEQAFESVYATVDKLAVIVDELKV